jgi:hypothetical protein
VHPNYKNPFDLFAQGIKSEYWGEWVDDFRTFLIKYPVLGELLIASAKGPMGRFCLGYPYLSFF